MESVRFFPTTIPHVTNPFVQIDKLYNILDLNSMVDLEYPKGKTPSTKREA